MNGNKESLEELITNLNTAQLSEQTGDRTHARTRTHKPVLARDEGVLALKNNDKPTT